MTAPVQDAIVLFGDSITQMGWMEGGLCQKLAENYVRKFDIVNRGLGGYNTEWAIPVFKQLIPPPGAQTQRARIITIWFGANDAVLPAFRQHVPIDAYRANLRTLVRLARGVESSVPTSAPAPAGTIVAIFTPPPVHVAQRRADLLSQLPPEERASFGEDNRLFEVTEAYAAAAREVAGEEGALLVDTWTALWDAAGRNLDGLIPFLADGLHLTPKGYSVVYDEFMKTIKKEMPSLHYENLQDVFINHNQIDVNGLEASLMKRPAEL